MENLLAVRAGGDHRPVSTQRQFPRYAIDAAVTIHGPDREVIARGRTTNVSRGGLCAELDVPLPRGAAIEAAIALVFDADSLSEPLLVTARVVWSTSLGAGHQTGLALVSVSPEQTHYLDMFIRFLERPGETDSPDDDDQPAPDPGERLRFDG